LRQLEDSFALAPEARAICARLLERVDRFAHLGQARFVCLASQPAVTLRGAECAAIVTVPMVQGPLKRLFDWLIASTCAPVLAWEEPDFLILIDAAVWSTLDAVRQERLMFHELCHVVARENEYGVPKLDAEGRPMLKLVPHDVEVFHDEIATYGPETCGIEDACLAIAEGIRAERRRRTDAA
jgi:hypothetical protein